MHLQPGGFVFGLGAMVWLLALPVQAQGHAEGTHGGILQPTWATPLAEDIPAPPGALRPPTPPNPRLAVPAAAGPVVVPDSPMTSLPPVLGPQAPGDLTTFANNSARPVGVALNTPQEPSVAVSRDTVLLTGNSYASLSRDSGQTWTSVNPYTLFPASDGGFCCDQRVLSVPYRDLTIWLLQYWYSGTTQTNRYRLAVCRGRDNLRSSTWYYYDFTPANLGYGTSTWLDFPDLAMNLEHLYLAANVFTSQGQNTGSAVWRVRLDELQAGGGVGYWYWNRSFLGASGGYRFSQGFGIGNRMHWASHLDTATLRIFYNDSFSTGVGWYDRSITTWQQGTMACAGPDGRDWCGSDDSRILGGYMNPNEVGFLWGCAPTTGRPRPYTRVARFRISDLTRIADDDIWNTDFAFLYPCAAPNARGHIGGTIAWGGGAFHPGVACFAVDDYRPTWAPLDWFITARGTSGPASNRWGDYFTVGPHPVRGETWIATGSTQQTGIGPTGSRQDFIWFGRERDQPAWVDLIVTSGNGLSGLVIRLDATDRLGQRDGTPYFQRTYAPRQGVTLSAPTFVVQGSTRWWFHQWYVNTAAQPVGEAVVTIPDLGTTTNFADVTYRREVPLAVRGINATAVPITVDTLDLLGQQNGTTDFTRAYKELTRVSLTAPLTAPNGAPFRAWWINGFAGLLGVNTVAVNMTGSGITAEAVYAPYTQGTLTSFGVGCPGNTGGNVTLQGFGTPDIGQRVTLLTSNGPRNGAGFVALGFTASSWSGVPLPLPVPGTSCTIYTELAVPFQFTTNGFGNGSLLLDVVNDPNLIGSHVYLQTWAFDPGYGYAQTLTFSNGLDLRHGGYR